MEKGKDWIEQMIELQATPSKLRGESVTDFCKRNKIKRGDYYYELSKEENKKRVLEIVLNKAKAECPDVLDTLVQKAKDGDMRAMDIYVDSILKLAKNLDIKTDGKPIVEMSYERARAIIAGKGGDKGDSKE